MTDSSAARLGWRQIEGRFSRRSFAIRSFPSNFLVFPSAFPSADYPVSTVSLFFVVSNPSPPVRSGCPRRLLLPTSLSSYTPPSMAARIKQIASHLQAAVTSPSLSARERILLPSPDDVVICAAVRTPLTKARKGGLAKASTDLLLSTVLKEVVRRSGIDPAEVEDVL